MNSLFKTSVFSLSLLLCLAFSSCGNRTDLDTDLIQNPNSAQGYDDSAKMPIISFEKEMHDFGRLTQGENISYGFKFTNTGNADLIISSCTATCGCTVADYPKGRIKPGESDYVTVSFKSAGKQGQQFQEVTVCTNAQPARVRLKIQAQVTM